MTAPKEALELKPCPFCGGPAHIQDADDERLFFVTCDSIECFCAVGEGYDRDAMPDHSFFSREEAAKAWNTRATASLQGEDAVERVAQTAQAFWQSPSGRSWIECCEKLPQQAEWFRRLARAILATGLVADEAAIRAAAFNECAEIADCMADEYDATSFTSTNAEQVAALRSKEQAAHEIAAAIRSGGGK